jgi:hypothetical protein
MKRKNFLGFVIMAIAMVAMLGLSSCSKEPCEKDNFGTVIVTNNGAYPIYVDCTQGSDEFNDERYLSVGQSTEYHMKPGEVTEWATPAEDYACNCNWFTDTYYLEQCEIHDEPWGSAKGESSIYKPNVSVKSGVIKNKE